MVLVIIINYTTEVLLLLSSQCQKSTSKHKASPSQTGDPGSRSTKEKSDPQPSPSGGGRPAAPSLTFSGSIPWHSPDGTWPAVTCHSPRTCP